MIMLKLVFETKVVRARSGQNQSTRTAGSQ
jgi:hypothetical protein